MPSLTYGIGAYLRGTGSLPPLECINLFVEKAKTSENEICLQARPGLEEVATNGTGPINAIYARPVIGDYYTVSGSTLYLNTTSLGTMASMGSLPISIAGTTSEILIASGGTLYSYNGTNLAATFIGIGNATDSVVAITNIGSMFVAVESDSARFYWSTPLDGRSWDALNFATAEREPDTLVDIAALNDNLILYGQSTVEVWAHTGDANLPFSRNEGMGSQSKGILTTGCKAEADNTLFHIGSDCCVYRFGEAFERVSDHWLEEKILASARTSITSVSMFTFRFEGHEFVCVRTGTQTFAYDAATGEWCELQTNGGQFAGKCAAMVGYRAYFGNGTDGKIMKFAGWDDLGDPLTAEFTAGVPLEKPVAIDNIWLWMDSGASTVLSGTGSDPKVEIAMSRDGGMTWSDFNDAGIGNAALGGAGQYRIIPEWRRLGMFDPPGAMFKFRVTDPVERRVSAVKFNAPVFGRSRG